METLTNPTLTAPRTPIPYVKARARAQEAFNATAAALGHAPGTRTVPIDGGGTLTQYACSCGDHRSPTTAHDLARRSWVAHARGKITAASRVVAS